MLVDNLNDNDGQGRVYTSKQCKPAGTELYSPTVGLENLIATLHTSGSVLVWL